MSPKTPEVFPVDLDHIPDIRLIAFDMDGTLLDDDDAIHDEFWPLIETGAVRPLIDSTFALVGADAAHRRMEGGDHIGKILLQVSGED